MYIWGTWLDRLADDWRGLEGTGMVIMMVMMQRYR